MNTISVHLICELSQCNSALIGSVEHVRKSLYTAATAANATALNGYFHQFTPTGVSGVLCLSESHLSIHTWPETGYAAMDIFTCGDTTTPHAAISVLAKLFEAGHVEVREVTRGIENGTGRYSSKDTTENLVPDGSFLPAPVANEASI